MRTKTEKGIVKRAKEHKIEVRTAGTLSEHLKVLMPKVLLIANKKEPHRISTVQQAEQDWLTSIYVEAPE